MWAACLIVFLFVYMLVLAPQQERKKQINKKLADIKNEYHSVLTALKKEKQKQIEEQIVQYQNQLKDFALNAEDSDNLTFDISEIAREQKLDFFSITGKNNRGLSAIPNCKHIYENYLDISFIAGFNRFATFLNALERHHPVVFVDSFTVTPSRRRDVPGHQVNMTVAVFVKKLQDS